MEKEGRCQVACKYGSDTWACVSCTCRGPRRGVVGVGEMEFGPGFLAGELLHPSFPFPPLGLHDDLREASTHPKGKAQMVGAPATNDNSNQQ